MEIKERDRANKRSLQVDTRLHNRYQIEEVLGEGGFGITYKAKQLQTNTKVAIKEYFPAELATRTDADSDQNLHIFRGDNEEFEQGKKRFLKEAGILRQYHYLEGIVPILDCFECNQTAYIVMEYIEGITLKQYVDENGCLNFKELLHLLEPVMKSLIKIHKQGLIHRDISPDNLMIGMDNHMRLIDFGAAQSTNEKYKKANTVILKAGYAPPEQYLSDGKQGAWTDVYALTSTMYMALTGKTPLDSVTRLQGKEELEIDFYVEDMEWWQKQAIEQGMNVKVSKRFKNVEELLEALTIKPTDENGITVHRASVKGKEKALINQTASKTGILVRNVVIVVCLLLGGTVIFWGLQRNQVEENDKTNSTHVDTQMHSTQENAEPELCKVPSVLLMTEMQAREAIYAVDANVSILVVKEPNTEVKKGLVISQSVEPETVYNKGAITEITLIVSEGEEITTEHLNDNSTSNSGASTKQKTTEKFHVIEDEEEYDEFKIVE